MHIAGSDRPVGFYNLDVIISVGYRVKSQRGTQFRIWATRTLREHLVRGYTLNEKRLAERGLKEARDTLDLLYGYPPDKQEKATQTVLEQAEQLSQEWVAA